VDATADEELAVDPLVPAGFIALTRMKAVAVDTDPDVPTASGVALTAFTLG
jgi:hypothetical protein